MGLSDYSSYYFLSYGEEAALIDYYSLDNKNVLYADCGDLTLVNGTHLLEKRKSEHDIMRKHGEDRY